MNVNLTRRQLAWGLCVLGAAGCGGGPLRGLDDAPIAQPNEYRLGPGDQVRITVFGEAELTGEFAVSAQGNIGYPLIGEVEAQGKTPTQLADAIGTRLQGGYVRQPNVTVDVINYRPFFILGEVETPGSYPYASNLTVMNAVAIAGGFTYRANRSRVFIRRMGEDNDREYRLTSTTPVSPGDTIRIPERFF